MTEAFSGYVCTSAAIDAAIAARSMLSHPFYQAWEQGALTKDALRAYARQYFHHVEAFPRAVSACTPIARARKAAACWLKTWRKKKASARGRTITPNSGSISPPEWARVKLKFVL